MRSMVGALLLSLTAAGAVAQETAPAAAPAPTATSQPAPAQSQEPQIVVEAPRTTQVCEVRRETGSIVPKRVCRTVEQLAAETEEGQALMEQLTRDQDSKNHTAASLQNR